MTIPIAEELNVRERVERLFETSTTEIGLDVAAACLQETTVRLEAIISTFVAVDFELQGPEVLTCAREEAPAVTVDQVGFQFRRTSTGTQFRCCLPSELVGLLVQAGFGGATTDVDADFNCTESAFCNFFVSNVALAAVRELASSVTGARSQNIVFDQTIEYDAVTAPEALSESGFLATWQLVFGAARHAMVVFLPMSEFRRLAGQDNEDDDEATYAADTSAWSDRMQSSLSAAEVQLRAVMNRPDMPLEQLYSLQVGDVVEFTDPQSSTVLLECDGEPLFDCDVGQKDGYFAVHVRGEL